MHAWLVPAQMGLALSKRDAGICGPLLPPMLNVQSLHLCKKFYASQPWLRPHPIHCSYVLKHVACMSSLLLLLSTESLVTTAQVRAQQSMQRPNMHITCVCWHAGEALLESPKEEALLPVEP